MNGFFKRYDWDRIYSSIYQLRDLCGPSEETAEVDFDGKTVLSTPHNIGRLLDAAWDIRREGFSKEKDRGNCRGFYIPELELICITNGYHHSAVAALWGGGTARLSVYRLSGIFDHIMTDGAYWQLDSGLTVEVEDIRVALLYSFAKEIHALKVNT